MIAAMNKIIIKSAFVAIVIGFSAACANKTLDEANLIDQKNTEKEIAPCRVDFSASQIDVKTVFADRVGDAYNVNWTASQQVAISLNYGAKADASVTPSSDNKTATFSAMIQDDAAAEKTFYAISPASACKSIDNSSRSVTVTVPAIQTCTAGSCDEAAQIVVAKSATAASFPTDPVSLHFTHLTTYMKVKLINLPLGESVTSVSLSSDQKLAGDFVYSFEDGSLAPSANAVSTVEVKTTSAENIWFALAPSSNNITSLTIVVNTVSGKAITREISGLGKALGKGRIAEFSVNMNEPKFVSSAYYLVGDMFSWDDKTKAGIFQKTSADNPVWNIEFTTLVKNQCWKILTQENYDSANIYGEGVRGILGVGVDKSVETEGDLITDPKGAGMIENPGRYVLEIDMSTYKFKITQKSKFEQFFISVDGEERTEANMNKILYPEGDNKYSFIGKFGDETPVGFKFFANPDFIGGTDALAFGVGVGNAVVASGASFIMPDNKYYYVNYDMKARTYSMSLSGQPESEYSSISLIGGWDGWANDVDMQKAGLHNWVLKNHTIAAAADGNNPAFKFRANHTWEPGNPSWGWQTAGEPAVNVTSEDTNVSAKPYNYLVQGGANMKITPGTYDIYFNDISGRFVFVKK